MNKSIIYASLGALLTALLVAMLVSSYTGQQKNVQNITTPQVLVAASDLPVGTVLNINQVRWQSWPTQNPPPNVILKQATQNNDWQKKKLRRAITKDEPILLSALVANAQGSFLAAALDKNMRAVAIDVKPDTSVGGFIAPGDFVDVVLTYPVRVQSNDSNALQAYAIENAADTILQAVKVLAVDQDATNTKQDTAKVAKTITLEVTADGTKKIALAKKMGELSLALRPLGDNKSGISQGVSDVSMLPLNQKMIQARQQIDPARQTIRVYSGGQVNAVPVKPNIEVNNHE
jgi:pilus assembly protein CpaB